MLSLTAALRCSALVLLFLSSIWACASATPEGVTPNGKTPDGASRESASTEQPVAESLTPNTAAAAAPSDPSLAEPASSSSAPLSEAAQGTSPPPAANPEAQLPQGSTVLHVGDSFAGALGPALNQELEAHGVKGILKSETATYIPTWASNKALPQYLERYKPDLVLITLGANELQIPDPEARAETVRRVVARLGERPCVWIGIPLWEGANPALMRVIADNAAPCLFLDSTALLPQMARARDKIHPSTAARSEWAKQVTAWLVQHQDPAASAWHWREVP